MANLKPQQKKEALELYLVHHGEISDSDLARQVGVSRKSIARWRIDGDWVSKVAEMYHEVVEKVTIEIAEHFEPLIKEGYEKEAKMLACIDQQLTNLLEKPRISALELKQVVTALSERTKILRLLQERSTENRAVNAKVESHLNHSRDGVDVLCHGELQKLIDKISEAEDGYPAGQTALMNLAQSFQEAVALVED